jgi:glycosyltransferase involved in cell wall biosynthesis
MKSNVAIIIPAFNEETSIANMVKKSLRYGDPIVVDDGSIDQTMDLAINQGAKTLVHKKNLGYDEALSTGLNYALRKGYKFAITIDADGQHNPEKIKIFSNDLENGIDLVLGYRDKMQRISEFLFSFVSKFLWKVRDPLCGMKGYRLSLIKDYGPFKTFNSYGTEFSIRLLRKNIKFSQVYIKTNKRADYPRIGGIFFTNLKIMHILFMLLFKLRV